MSSSLDAIHRDLISARSLLVGLFYLLFALINYTAMLDEFRLSTTLLAVSVTIVFFMLSAFHKFKDYAATYTNHLSFVELGILQADGMAFLILTQDIMSGFGVFIMIMSTGIFLTTTPWILASVIRLSASWMFAPWTNDIAILIAREGLLWVTSVIFCFFFYTLRLRSARRLGEYQLRQDAYRAQLEGAAQKSKR